jgi:hypothetical protein
MNAKHHDNAHHYTANHYDADREHAYGFTMWLAGEILYFTVQVDSTNDMIWLIGPPLYTGCQALCEPYVIVVDIK